MNALLLGLLLCAAPSPAGDAPIAPVAVMPFKDLAGGGELAWLSQGIAETMMVDLKKGSRLQVVEREQLHHALEELKLQGEKGIDESSAVHLGKMVGARTVVLGSYQRAGLELRIVARLVDVETGVVRDAAKVTGHVEDVFELQDQIVVKLAGTPFGDAVKRRKPKPKKTLDAYRLYAQSFTVMSDADREDLLERSLKEDPDFQYAAEDLLELQDRIKHLSAADQQATNKQAEAYRAKVLNKKLSAMDRANAAIQLVSLDAMHRRPHAGLRDSAAVLATDLPDEEPMHLRALVLSQRMRFYADLRELPLAMQVAENLMKLYPGTPYFLMAQSMLGAWSTQRAQELEDERTFEAKLQMKRDEVSRAQASAARSGRPPSPNQVLSWDQAPCDVMDSAHQYRAAAACYQALLDHPLAGDGLRERYGALTLRLMHAALESGQFELARRTGERFQRDDPELALRYAVAQQMLAIPED